jgi:hypothetical protein
MPDILFPLSSSPGFKGSESAGRLLNCYAEKLGDEARAPFVRRKVPGLARLIDTQGTAARGFHFHNGSLYIAQADRMLRVNRGQGEYTVTDLGSLPGDGMVTFAQNNKAPVPDIVVSSEDGLYKVYVDGPPESLDAGELPQPNSICFIDGYIMATVRDGRVYASGLNDTTFSALDFAKAESRSGGTLRGIPFGQQLLLCGPNAIEVWANRGNPEGFPFSRSAVIPRGLAAPFAIAGHEDGFATALLWVGDDSRVYRLDGGYTPVPVSEPDLNGQLDLVKERGQLDQLRAQVYVTRGHAHWSITGPGFTWVYDIDTGKWHERQSYGLTHWIARCSISAFGDWLVGDEASGKVYALRENIFTEDGDLIAIEVISTPATAYPNRVAVPRADFSFAHGQGQAPGQDPIQTDPQVEISWSDDGGFTYSTPVRRSIGRQGQYGARVTVNRCGMTGPQGRQWKLRCSDPVYFGLLGGSQEAQARFR